MILQALTNYYEQLVSNGQLSAPGWTDNFKVSFWIRINEKGDLVDLVDCRQNEKKGKKDVLSPRNMTVPAHVGRSSGIKANFLCDNAIYLLGLPKSETNTDKKRAAECFEAASKLHHDLLERVDSPAAQAILAFFDSWNPEKAAENPLIQKFLKELLGGANLLFDYEGPEGNILTNEDISIREAWQKAYDSDSTEGKIRQCLVTGIKAKIAETHPPIKNLSKDCPKVKLVSYNKPAFCSYGFEQGENGPVSEYAAFAYTTALNHLLSKKEVLGDKKEVLGDTTIVCWAENASPGYSQLGMMGMFGIQEELGITEDDLKKAIKLLSQGRPCSWLGETLRPDQHFYVLGLAPNLARLSVRFFLKDTFGNFSKHLQEHADALEIVYSKNDKKRPLSLWTLAEETVRKPENEQENKKENKQKDKTEDKSKPKPKPRLAGDLLRAVLTGGRYPATLLNGVHLRIRAEQNVTYEKAAILKAYYIRNGTDNEQFKEVLTVKLNEESNYAPYVLGRLFSVLEAIQSAANPGINSTIRERYFSSACATPAMVFPTLINLAQKHLNKLSAGQEVYFNKQLTDLLGRMEEDYPAHLTLPEQGAFQIGYYHQMQKRYEKKNEEE